MSVTFKNQKTLANYCRTGVYEPIQGVNAERASHYRRLVFNVIEGTLTNCYPLASDVLGAEQWKRLVNDFFSVHKCDNPYLWKMPFGLIGYIELYEKQLLLKYPYLLELLHFEWLETQVFMQEDREPLAKFVTHGNIKKDFLVINPETELRHYEYPVHLKIAKDIHQNDKGNYFISAHRHIVNGYVFFMDLSPISLRMVEILSESPQTLDIIVKEIQDELNIKISDEIYNNMVQFLEAAQKNNLLLGFKI